MIRLVENDGRKITQSAFWTQIEAVFRKVHKMFTIAHQNSRLFLRKEKGFTQEYLALEMEISVSYLRRIEHGEANPTINELWKIAEVLEVELCNPFAVAVPALVV